MRVSVGQGVATTQGGALTRDELQAKVRVPDIASFFKIEDRADRSCATMTGNRSRS